MSIRRSVVQGLMVVAGVGAVAAAFLLSPAPSARAPHAPSVEAPIILGRRENCLVCHAGIEGLDASHQPERIGCASCHGGNIESRDAQQAHAGIILIPGNVSDAPRTCGQAMCHPSIIPRVERSIMTTMAGVVEVNRRVFGERSLVAPHVGALGSTPADTHLRQLCASCHLGQLKTEWGPVDEEYRGGGCNACHLVYDSAAARQLTAYTTTPPKARTGIPRRHPTFSIAVGNVACFGCHSRSGRISTNYEGWHELRDAPSDAAQLADARSPTPQYRLLDDGRFFTRVTPDAHQARGMDCIDCHTAGEVMGTGSVVSHARDQVQIRCEDCHASRFASVPPAHADAETQQLTALRGWTFRAGERLAVAASGSVLANVVVAPDQSARLRHKRTGTWAPLRPPRTVCTQGSGHTRLSCNTCHTAWAPRCATCHTSFDALTEGYDHVEQQYVKGAWQESSGPFEAAPPTLGIRATPRDASRPHGVVDTFIPGMILTIDRNRTAGGAPDSVFRRLYARTFSHTISRAARSCESCHSDPVALGYGRGALRYAIADGVGRWTFAPALERLADGLPADAWTGFLQSRRGMVSTRDDVRPFTAEEQRRILAVGACLTCHAGTTSVMQRAIADFAGTLARRTGWCVAPKWD
jgi:hypothetical protein